MRAYKCAFPPNLLRQYPANGRKFPGDERPHIRRSSVYKSRRKRREQRKRGGGELKYPGPAWRIGNRESAHEYSAGRIGADRILRRRMAAQAKQSAGRLCLWISSLRVLSGLRSSAQSRRRANKLVISARGLAKNPRTPRRRSRSTARIGWMLNRVAGRS